MSFQAEHIEALNHNDVHTRLETLHLLVKEIERDEARRPEPTGAVNNHIHTFYSFSPYSPTKAVWMSYLSGLETTGLMDHDSISGAREFIEAGRIIGMATTIGVECRAGFSNTPLKGRRINHPDQESAAYVALHGIPHTQIDRVATFFSPYQSLRNERNRRMIGRLNQLLEPYRIEIDFERDVVPLSMAHEGGSVTERHLLYSLAEKLVDRFGRGEDLIRFLEGDLKLSTGGRVVSFLRDVSNPYYIYDLLGVLKSGLVPAFYIDAMDEMPDIREVLAFSDEIGAISAYAYLGDIGDSVTGDKKSQKFEDDYLDLLFETLVDLGFKAVTYMPSRNTLDQLNLVKEYCERYGFFQISGEDINSPRQSFICEAAMRPEFGNLIDSTWALIGHERAATEDLSAGMFSEEIVSRFPDLNERIRHFKEIGKNKEFIRTFEI